MIRPGVKGILPRMYHEICRGVADNYREAFRRNASAMIGTIIFTGRAIPLSSVPHAERFVRRSEDRLPPCPWPTPPARREGPRRAVPLSTLLRSSRPAPGPLRDAPPPSGRRSLHPPGGRALRGQSSHVLPRGDGLPRPWPSRPPSAETRPEGSASMHSRDRCLRSIASPGGPPTFLGRIAARDRPPVRGRTSPSKDRGAGPRQGTKKRAPENRPTGTTALSSSVEPEYEALRNVAMKDTSSSPSRLGLGVFLLRGWVGWAEALPALHPASPPPSLDRRLSPATPVDPDREVIHALAGLVLSYLGDRP